MNMPVKRKRLSLKEKISIINKKEKEKISTRTLAKQYLVSKTQICDIMKNKQEIVKLWLENDGYECGRKFSMQSPGYSIDNFTYKWFSKARENNIYVSGPNIRKKALEIANELGLKDFKASSGWLNKFCKRHNISLKKALPPKEKLLTDNDAFIEWKTEFHHLFEKFEPRNIFNSQATVILFRSLTDDVPPLKDDNNEEDEKILNEKLTVMLCVNVNGEFEKPLVIGNTTKPKCFKKLDMTSLKITWRSNRQALITEDLMAEWLKDFDQQMIKENRQICLILDNSLHPVINLVNIKLIFMPLDIAAAQPLNQGIIKQFKVNYRQCILRHVLPETNDIAAAKQLSRTINIFDAIHWILISIKDISQKMVEKCFAKAGVISNDDSGKEGEMELDPDNLQPFTLTFSEFVSVENDSNDYIESDEHDESMTPTLKHFTPDDDDDDAGIKSEENSKQMFCSNEEAIDHLVKLKTYFAQNSDKTGLKLIEAVELHVNKHLLHNTLDCNNT